MSSLLLFERAKFGALCVEAAATRKEVSTSLLEEAWESLEVSKIAPEESLRGNPSTRKSSLCMGFLNLLLGFDEILQQVMDRANCEVEAYRNREEKCVKIMAWWRDENKVLTQKIVSLEAKLLEDSSQEDTSNKSQGQDNNKFDWLDLDLSQIPQDHNYLCSKRFQTVPTLTYSTPGRTKGPRKKKELREKQSHYKKNTSKLVTKSGSLTTTYTS
ncbi:hypothetical protein DSO57_1031775 [Entomophthora muscae]|uniref:Uncharacterized protein n=1 Tax=Entomophthora muscae TaxID=34485 RepID=A0ACC2S2E7_9FUNG|nr:hypothetical protein DSO57_1031775 [Entomophthora muscae]